MIVSAGGVTMMGTAGTVLVTTGGVTVTVGAGDGLAVTVCVGAGKSAGLVAAMPILQPTKEASRPIAMAPRVKPARRRRGFGAGWDMMLRCTGFRCRHSVQLFSFLWVSERVPKSIVSPPAIEPLSASKASAVKS